MQHHASSASTASGDQYTFAENAILYYNCVMMVLILLNVITLFLDRFLVGDLGQAFFEVIHLAQFGAYYVQQIHPMVTHIEAYFTGYLIAELLVRWGYAIYCKAHARWFFFPIIRVYEVLAILPELRFLRLIRVGMIAYELKQHKIRFWPKNLEKNLLHYFEVIMEWLTDQIIIAGVRQLHKDGIDADKIKMPTSNLIEEFAKYTGENKTQIKQKKLDALMPPLTKEIEILIQQEMSSALKKHELKIVNGVGVIVKKALQETSEIHDILKFMPLVGSKIEERIQKFGQALGENITKGLVEQFIVDDSSEHTQNRDTSNQNYRFIAEQLVALSLEKPHIKHAVYTASEMLKIKVDGISRLENLDHTQQNESSSQK